MAKKIEELRLNEIPPGMVVLMDDPVRVCKVLGPESWEEAIISGGRKAMVSRPGVGVRSVLPTQAIRGFVSETVARIAQGTREALYITGLQLESPVDDTWEEVWAERSVPTLVNYPGVAPKLDKNKPHPQLYVAFQRGREGKREHTSPVVTKVVAGRIIPPELVPDELFNPTDIEEMKAMAIQRDALAGTRVVDRAGLRSSVEAEVRAKIEAENEMRRRIELELATHVATPTRLEARPLTGQADSTTRINPVAHLADSLAEQARKERWTDLLTRKDLQALAKTRGVSAGQSTEVLRQVIFAAGEA